MRAKRDISEALSAAAEEIGMPRNDDFNGAKQEGVGNFQQTARNGRRCPKAVGFLNPVKNRSNLDIITLALVEKVLVKDDRATGIGISVKGSSHTLGLNSGGEVILSAGAIGSPQILQLSGKGPGDLLQGLGIPITKDLAGVGENLQTIFRFVHSTR